MRPITINIALGGSSVVAAGERGRVESLSLSVVGEVESGFFLGLCPRIDLSVSEEIFLFSNLRSSNGAIVKKTLRPN